MYIASAGIGVVPSLLFRERESEPQRRPITQPNHMLLAMTKNKAIQTPTITANCCRHGLTAAPKLSPWARSLGTKAPALADTTIDPRTHDAIIEADFRDEGNSCKNCDK